MFDNVEEYIKPELLVLIPVLYFVGAIIKKTSYVSDKHIPLIVGIFGIVLATIYVLATSSSENYLQGLFVGITQGVLCAGCSVYANQVVKQETQRKE